MELLGISQEEFEQILRLVNERRRISLDLLKAHLGSTARATNALSALELNRFICKPLGSQRWHIDFPKIEQYLNTPSLIENSEATPITANITIKTGSLPSVLKELYLADHNFNIARMLTTDLTIPEIEDSLEIIEQFKNKYKSFVQQYALLEAKQKDLKGHTQGIEEKIQDLKNTISSKFSTSLIATYVMSIAALIAIVFYATTKGILPVGVLTVIGIFITLVGCLFVIPIISKQKKAFSQLQVEKKNLENTLKAICDDKAKITNEKENLAKVYNLTKNATPLPVILSNNKLAELEDVLKKMKNILMDFQEVQSKKILALEKLIYIIDKKYNDSIMLEEQQKATEYTREQAEYIKKQTEKIQEQTQAMRDIEEAVRKQREFQAYVEIVKDIDKKGR